MVNDVNVPSATGTPDAVSVSSLGSRTLRLVPGVALLFAIGYAGKRAEALLRSYGQSHHVAVPNIEYVLWAILIGLLIGNLLAGS
jgi:hypothetical protein